MADIAVSRAIPDALSSLEVRVYGGYVYTLYANHTMHVGGWNYVLYPWKKDSSGRYVFLMHKNMWKEFLISPNEHMRIDSWLAEIELMKAVEGSGL